MTEKNKSEKMTNSSKPVPMKLFAAWEVDRTPSNCIPRLCTLRVTRLKVCGALGEAGGGAASGAGAGAVILAARMHSSKRTLRSNDIAVPPLDVELDLCFSLQYPHFVKRDGNRLQIMLQRRKKYKNRTILGYKTLAEGVIRMDQVLQRSMDMELELTGVGAKVGAAAGQPVAKLTITGLASTPVDHDTKNNNTLLITERGYSDEEEEGEFSSVEEADEMTYGAPARRRHRQIAFNKTDLSYTKLSRSRDLSFMERERKRQSYIHSKANDRDSDSELEHAAAKRKGSRGKLAPEGPARHTQRGAGTYAHELESLSCGEGEDSGPDQMDTISIGSTPKPSLRPFFSSSRSLANQDHHRHSNVTRHSSLTSGGELSTVREKTGTVAPTESEAIRSSAGDERGSDGNSDGDVTADAPVSGASVSSSPPNETKEDKRSRLFRSATSGSNLTPGGAARKKNSLVSAAERPLSAHELPVQSPTTLEPRRTMMEQISRLLGEEGPIPECIAVAPAGGVANALHALGVPTIVVPWPHTPDVRPLLQALFTIRFPIVPQIVCKGTSGCPSRHLPDWMATTPGLEYAAITTLSCVPALNTNSCGRVEVRVGCSEGGVSSLELEEGGSPPARPSPPGTPLPPHLAHSSPQDLTAPPLLARTAEPLELQLDFWLVIMRLGKKKEKGGEMETGRTQTVEGVARLICSHKGSHNTPLKVYIDGTEWNGVKFFQVSTQWQTHVKTFPVATCGAPLAPAET
ncbi:hypothetical protein K1T71_010960 [Dendrolimus kikuchii]|uniref:Uncharacterized protein n=1 Tax=Dendrolimus kikuchii TaxID=765133 RepID=A0ACC1CQN5_9NEOP|nr:hypothetical protein K1T71_010960 [Dendrolimus kikuchii]